MNSDITIHINSISTNHELTESRERSFERPPSSFLGRAPSSLANFLFPLSLSSLSLFFLSLLSLSPGRRLYELERRTKRLSPPSALSLSFLGLQLTATAVAAAPSFSLSLFLSLSSYLWRRAIFEHMRDSRHMRAILCLL